MPRTAARHSMAIAVLDDTLALDLAVAIQAFGQRPSAFLTMRDDLRSPYDLFLCGAPRTELRTVGMGVTDLRPWSALLDADTIVVPGLDRPEHPRNPEALEAIAAAAARGTRLVGLCAGVFVLGHAGVLAGHRVTTHWALADRFRSLFPDVELLDDELFLDDGQVLSSGGMLAAADLCLHILRQDHGQAYANDVARLLVTPPFRTGGQAPYRSNGRPIAGSALSELITWIDGNLAQPITLRMLAAQAGTSTRTLARRFDVETGRGALQWVNERRVAKARALLEETDRTVTEIAFATGFGSLGAFRRQFARHTGTTPRHYRQTFRAGPRSFGADATRVAS